MALLSTYTNLITSRHADKPKFMATVAALCRPLVDFQNFCKPTLQMAFDLDTAIGTQLDQVGKWIGRARTVSIPISGAYFTWDAQGLGWDQGTWQGQFDSQSGIVSLDDDTYRNVLRAKIILNSMDGRIDDAALSIAKLFSDFPNTIVSIKDNQDMTMTVSVSGVVPPAVYLALLDNNELVVAPSGVGVDFTVTSVNSVALFGWDTENATLKGWDQGAWSGSLGIGPGQVTGLSLVSVTSTTANLSWIAPLVGTGPFTYQVEQNLTGSTGAFSLVGLPTNSTTFTVTGLNPGTSYQFEVYAVNDSGAGIPSPILTVVTPGGAPPQVTGVTATATTANSIALSWASAGSGVTYTVQDRVSGTGGAFTTVTTTQNTTATIENLAPSTLYDIQVLASNATASGQPSAVLTTATATGTTVTPPPTGNVPDPVGSLAVVSTGTTDVKLGWIAPSGTVTSYVVQFAKSGTTLNYTPFTSASPVVNGTTVTIDVTGLASSTSYSFEVYAVNTIGNGAISVVTATTASTTVTPPPVPGAVTNLTVTAANTTDLALSWTAASGTVTSYQVLVAKNVAPLSYTAFTATKPAVSGNTVTVDVTGLTAATSYSIQVYATNATGNGGSQTITASTAAGTAAPPPLPGAVTALKVVSAGTNDVSLSWTAPSGSVVSSYGVMVAPNVSPLTYAMFTAVSPTVSGTTVTVDVTGLNASTSYSFAVYASNVTGNGPQTAVVGTTATPVPAQVSGLALVSDTANSATLSWNAVSGAASYQVQYQEAGTTTWTNGPLVNTTSATVTLPVQSTTTTSTSGGTPTPTPTPTPTAALLFDEEWNTLDITDTGGAAQSGFASITNVSGGSVTDGSGGVWTIVNGEAYLNGSAPAYSSNVALLEVVNGVVWVQNQSSQWYSWTNGAWTPGSAPTSATGGAWMNHYAFGGSEYTLSWGNEAEYYAAPSRTPGFNPFSVSNGILTITADSVAHTVANPLGLPYNSGAITTATESNGMPTPGLYARQYGYLESRMLLPKGTGLWPAFWLMPSDGGAGEIDIFEALGNDTGNIYCTLHFSGNTSANSVKVPVSDYSVNWHVYGFDWQPDYCTWYVDGIQVVQMPTPAEMQRCPYYILINLAVGAAGSWPGPPDSSTAFPAHMQVDYVRWYDQMPVAGSTPAPTPTPTATSNVQAKASGTRLWYNQPGTEYCFWNTPMGSGATYSQSGDADTQELTNRPDLGGTINTPDWYGSPMYVSTSSSDPIATFKIGSEQIYGGATLTNETVVTHIPAGATAAGPLPLGSDQAFSWADVTNYPGIYFFAGPINVNNYQGGLTFNILNGGPYDNTVSNTTFFRDHATYDLYATQQELGGAAPYSQAAGMIRSYDLDPNRNPARIPGTNLPRIQHVLRYSLDPSQMKPNGTGDGQTVVNPSGWPIAYEDYQSGGNVYTGNILAGSHLAIPPGTQRPAGLTNAGIQLWDACVNYGCSFHDVSGGGLHFFADQDVCGTQSNPTTWLQQAQNDMNTIMNALRIVRNQHQKGQSFTDHPVQGPGTRLDTGPGALSLIPGFPVPSASGSYLTPGASAVLTDTTGTQWSLTSAGKISVAAMNIGTGVLGAAAVDTSVASAKVLAFVQGVIYYQDASGLWYGKTAPWNSWSTGSTTAPLTMSATGGTVTETAPQGGTTWNFRVYAVSS